MWLAMAATVCSVSMHWKKPSSVVTWCMGSCVAEGTERGGATTGVHVSVHEEGGGMFSFSSSSSLDAAESEALMGSSSLSSSMSSSSDCSVALRRSSSS